MGSAITPAVTITDADGNKLTEGTDFAVSYSDNVERGTATVTATGTGNYVGTISMTFEIYGGETIDLGAEGAVTVTASDVAYTGAIADPEIVVKTADGVTLIAGSEYTISIPEDAIAPGTYTATISGASDSVTGEATATFDIVKSDVGVYATIEAIADATYTGASITPKPAVKNSYGTTLAEGTDYVVVYADNTAVGTASIVVVGQGNYTGTATTTFQIVGTTFDAAGVAAPSIPDQAYDNGKAVEPAFTLTNSSGVELVKGVDYLVSYESNTAKGTASATIVGWGAYSGVLNAQFNIIAANTVTASAVKSAHSLAYGYNATTIAATDAVAVQNAVGTVTYAKKSGDDAITVASDGTISIASGLFTGNYPVTITVNAAGDASTASGNCDVSFDVQVASSAPSNSSAGSTPADSTPTTPVTNVRTRNIAIPTAVSGLVYNGSTQTGVTSTGDGYAVYNNTATAAGTYKAVAIVTDDARAFTDGSTTKEITWSIGKRSLSGATVTLANTSLPYTGKKRTTSVSRVTLAGTAVSSSDYTVSAPSGTAVGTYRVTVSGTGNYTGTATASFSITKASNSVTVAKTKLSQSYASNKKGKLAKAKSIALPSASAAFGTVKWSVSAKDSKGVLSLASGKVKVKKGAAKGTYTMTVKASAAGTDNYASATSKAVKVTVEVK